MSPSKVSNSSGLRIEGAKEVLDLAELVLRQGFGGKEVDGAAPRVFQHGLHDGYVVAHALAGGARRWKS